MKGVYLISTLVEKRVNVFKAINNERKETWGRACIRRKSSGDNFYFLWESHRWLLEIENDGKKEEVNFCLKMSGKRWYFESVDYCLLDIWIDNKSFGQLGELTSILFKDFGLPIGLSRDPRKNWGGRSLFSRGHSLLLIFCYQTHSLTVEEIKILGGQGQRSSTPVPHLFQPIFSRLFYIHFRSGQVQC